METLLGSIAGLTLVPFGEGDQCCGFGGTFSVAFPNISSGMGTLKLEHLRAARPDLLVSGDMSCLMHLCGLAGKEGEPIKGLHFAQLLRDSLHDGHAP
jgi:L-lactate dehydrogenase complex protein LldE